MQLMLRLALLAVVALTCPAWRHGAGGIDVPTHLYDMNRTGWNQRESSLTPASVQANFGLVCSRTDLDGTVEGQPLLVRRVVISDVLYNDVLYIATGANTVYAINGADCSTITSVNLGTPVTLGGTTFDCGLSSNPMGVDGTSVIDVAAHTLYVLASTAESGHIVHRLHALDLSTLADKVASRTVTATGRLKNGVTYTFVPDLSKHRPALALGNGNIYASFGSPCEDATSRGWVIAWNKDTLAPAGSELTNGLTADGINFLSAIWHSGGGPVIDGSGNVYVITGNGQTATYNPPIATQETMAKLSPSLSLIDYFTPYNVDVLDAADSDFTSGAPMALPDQAGNHPHLIVAAGKDGQLFLMDRDSLGGFTPGGPNNVLGTYNIGGCWCAQNYYVGTDGTARVISRGGTNGMIWQVTSGPTALNFEANLPLTPNGVNGGGSMGTVSSNQTGENTRVNHIIWTLGRPGAGSPPAEPTLYAFDPTTRLQIFRQTAGVWLNLDRNYNNIPVVARGHVYVASDGQLFVFGRR